MTSSDVKFSMKGLQDRALVVLEVIVGVAVVAAVMGKAYGTAPTVLFVLCGLAATYTGYSLYKMVSTLSDPTLEMQGRTQDEAREALEYEKRLLLQGIKELEADYGVGKVDRRDYDMLRRTAETRAVGIIAKLREDDVKWQRRAEALVAERMLGLAGPTVQAEPATAAAPTAAPAPQEAPASTSTVFDDRPAEWRADGDRFKCMACETLNDPDGRFCQACGRPRAKEAA